MLTLERLKEALRYHPETGDFIWVNPPSKRVAIGSVAGSKHAKGYITVSLDRRFYRAHRLAWFYMTGRWPNAQIDHINGIRDDNRWCNLRDVSAETNQRNRTGVNRNNKIGLPGVSWAKRGGWFARIWVDGGSKFLGYYPTPEDAHKAYLVAKRELHGNRPILKEFASQGEAAE